MFRVVRVGVFGSSRGRPATAGWRAGRASVGGQQRSEGLAAAEREVAQGLRGVVPPALVQDQRQHNVVAGRTVGRRQAAARRTGVFAERLVAAMVVLRLDRPVATIPGQQLLRRRAVGRQ